MLRIHIDVETSNGERFTFSQDEKLDSWICIDGDLYKLISCGQMTIGSDVRFQARKQIGNFLSKSVYEVRKSSPITSIVASFRRFE